MFIQTCLLLTGVQSPPSKKNTFLLYEESVLVYKWVEGLVESLLFLRSATRPNIDPRLAGEESIKKYEEIRIKLQDFLRWVFH